MTERIGDIKTVQNFVIEPPIYMKLDSFANTLQAYGKRVVDYANGFLIIPNVFCSRYWDNNNSRLIETFDVERLFYTPVEPCREFLVLKDDGHASMEDSVAKQTYQGIFKIIKSDEHQLGDMHKVILKTIEKSESIRKSRI